MALGGAELGGDARRADIQPRPSARLSFRAVRGSKRCCLLIALAFAIPLVAAAPAAALNVT